MENKQSRRRFLGHCATVGGACCALLAFNRHLPAQDKPEQQKAQGQKPINFAKLSYCGIPCAQVCELYKATQENDVQKKKLEYEKQDMKKAYGIEFDPDKVFCYTCKPGDKPNKLGMDACVVRKCAIANGMESCVQCKNLAACDKEFWKKWTDLYQFNKNNQTRYLTEPGAALRDVKAR